MPERAQADISRQTPELRPVSLLSPLTASLEGARPRGSLLLLLLVVATLLRTIDLGDGLWIDEIDTLVHYVRLPLDRILTTFDSKNQHLLYSVLAHWSVGVFGESAWALRLPAVIFGVASIAALVWFGSLVTTRRESLATAGLLTFSYHHVWFSQNARGYTALLLATLVASALMLRMAAETKLNWRLAAGYSVTMALALYMHLTAALIVAGHLVWWAGLVVTNRSKTLSRAIWLPLGAFVVSGLLALVLYAPVLRDVVPTLLAPSMGGDTMEWKNPLWFAAETLRGLRGALPGGWLTLALAFGVSMLGLVSYARRSGAIVSLMLLPVAITAVAMLATSQNLWPRFFFFAVGFGALIVMRGVFAAAERLWPARGQIVALAAAGLLMAASAATVPKAWNPKQDYVGARQFVERSRVTDDAIVTVDIMDFPYREYYRLNWLVAADSAQLASIDEAHARTWVLTTFPLRLASVKPGLSAYIQRHYVKAAQFPGTVAGGEITVMVRR
jgi:hypothetical protein